MPDHFHLLRTFLPLPRRQQPRPSFHLPLNLRHTCHHSPARQKTLIQQTEALSIIVILIPLCPLLPTPQPLTNLPQWTTTASTLIQLRTASHHDNSFILTLRHPHLSQTIPASTVHIRTLHSNSPGNPPLDLTVVTNITRLYPSNPVTRLQIPSTSS